jgi:hypothetical protein
MATLISDSELTWWKTRDMEQSVSNSTVWTTPSHRHSLRGPTWTTASQPASTSSSSKNQEETVRCIKERSNRYIIRKPRKDLRLTYGRDRRWTGRPGVGGRRGVGRGPARCCPPVLPLTSLPGGTYDRMASFTRCGVAQTAAHRLALKAGPSSPIGSALQRRPSTEQKQ